MTPAASAKPLPLPGTRAPAFGGSSATAPPIWLPGQHFAAALVFFVVGSVGLAFVAPDLANGAFYLPRVVAVVHLIVLGFIVLSIFGALCQFLPVAIGRPIRSIVSAQLSFSSHLAGVSLFVTALVIGNRGLLQAGALLLALSFLSFAGNLAATLKGAKERSLTFWALAFASFFLALTPIYGVALALNLHGDLALENRFALVAIHAHVALVGFVLLVIVGVAHRLLPMFLLSHGASERPAWIAVFLLAFGALALALPVGGEIRFIIAGLSSISGTLAFLVQAVGFYRHRKRRAVDPGMRLAGMGLSAIALAALLAPIALSRGLLEPRLLITYFVVLLGGVSLFVAGHYYKIVPFLVWYHRFSHLVGKRKVPNVAELYSQRAALANAALLALGVVGIALSAFFGKALPLRFSALVFAAGAVVELFMIAQVARRKLA